VKSHPIILVAEDDPVFRRVIAFSLVAGGFQCLTASNGQEAFSILQNAPVDLLVTDHQMPICSGLELIEKVRHDEKLKQLPIVLCTAKGFELNATELIQVYALLTVMRKPFSPRQMISLIADYLSKNPVHPEASTRGKDETATLAAIPVLTPGLSFAALQTAAPHA
jgi:two-component system, chemotaxis family, chemotaxis protein CheY